MRRLNFATIRSLSRRRILNLQTLNSSSRCASVIVTRFDIDGLKPPFAPVGWVWAFLNLRQVESCGLDSLFHFASDRSRPGRLSLFEAGLGTENRGPVLTPTCVHQDGDPTTKRDDVRSPVGYAHDIVPSKIEILFLDQPSDGINRLYLSLMEASENYGFLRPC